MLMWGSQNSVSTRFTKPYFLTCRVLRLLLSAGVDTIPKYRYTTDSQSLAPGRFKKPLRESVIITRAIIDETLMRTNPVILNFAIQYDNRKLEKELRTLFLAF